MCYLNGKWNFTHLRTECHWFEMMMSQFNDDLTMQKSASPFFHMRSSAYVFCLSFRNVAVNGKWTSVNDCNDKILRCINNLNKIGANVVIQLSKKCQVGRHFNCIYHKCALVGWQSVPLPLEQMNWTSISIDQGNWTDETLVAY